MNRPGLIRKLLIFYLFCIGLAAVGLTSGACFFFLSPSSNHFDFSDGPVDLPVTIAKNQEGPDPTTFVFQDTVTSSRLTRFLAAAPAVGDDEQVGILSGRIKSPPGIIAAAIDGRIIGQTETVDGAFTLAFTGDMVGEEVVFVVLDDAGLPSPSVQVTAYFDVFAEEFKATVHLTDHGLDSPYEEAMQQIQDTALAVSLQDQVAFSGTDAAGQSALNVIDVSGGISTVLNDALVGILGSLEFDPDESVYGADGETGVIYRVTNSGNLSAVGETSGVPALRRIKIHPSGFYLAANAYTTNGNTGSRTQTAAFINLSDGSQTILPVPAGENKTVTDLSLDWTTNNHVLVFKTFDDGTYEASEYDVMEVPGDDSQPAPDPTFTFAADAFIGDPVSDRGVAGNIVYRCQQAGGAMALCGYNRTDGDLGVLLEGEFDVTGADFSYDGGYVLASLETSFAGEPKEEIAIYDFVAGGTFFIGTGSRPRAVPSDSDLAVYSSPDADGNLQVGLFNLSEMGLSGEGNALSITPGQVELASEYSAVFTASGGTPPYTFSVVSGSGTLASSTGIFKAPVDAGAVVVRVTDALGETADADVTVNGSLSCADLTVAANGVSANASPSGGVSPYSYSLASGVGSVNSSGLYAPPNATGNAVVRATDVFGITANCAVTVNPQLTSAGNSAQVGVNGVPHYKSAPAQPVATLTNDGVPPYAYALVAGNGSVSGGGVYTPPNAQTQLNETATVRVTDSIGNTADVPFAVQDNNPNLASLVLSAGTLNVAFDPNTTAYTGNVNYLAPSIALTPTGEAQIGGQALSTVTVDGTAVVSGSPSAFLPLATGLNAAINTVVTSLYGSQRTYAVTLTREGLGDFVQQAYAKAPAAVAGAHGYSVAIDGDTMVVGARDTVLGGSTIGQAHVYTRSAGAWAYRATLSASNAEDQDQFGASVAIDDGTIVVGAPLEDSNATGISGNEADNSANNSGAVYVFTGSGATWNQQAYLKASNTGQGDQFGGQVALSGETIAVGAHREESAATGVNGNQADNTASEAGAVYVFTRSGSTWSQQAYIKASNSATQDFFGASLALNGDTLAVGATGEDSNATGINGNQADNSHSAAGGAGAVYVFTRSGSTWSQQAYVKASNSGGGDLFGASVSLSRETMVVGANGEASAATGVNGNEADNTQSGIGAAYVFTRSGTTWSQQAYLKQSTSGVFGGAGDGFGGSVAVFGDVIIVGAMNEDSVATGINGNEADNGEPSSGAAYVFTRSGTTWTQRFYLKASNAQSNDLFGNAVAAEGDTVIVGARFEGSNATGVGGSQVDNSLAGAGAVYVFQ